MKREKADLSKKNTPPENDSFEQKVLQFVGRIPRGKVATYGQVAALAGRPKNSRQIGKILGGLKPGDRTPWHRVVNAQGGISLRAEPHGTESLQKKLLEFEGITFGRSGRIQMEKFAWDPPLEQFLGGREKRGRMPNESA